jgi:hypothetical protein
LSVRGGSRTIALRVSTNRPATGTIALLRKTKQMTTRKYRLPKGRSTLRLGVPRQLTPGWYIIAARFTSAAGQVDVERRPFHLTA